MRSANCAPKSIKVARRRVLCRRTALAADRRRRSSRLMARRLNSARMSRNRHATTGRHSLTCSRRSRRAVEINATGSPGKAFHANRRAPTSANRGTRGSTGYSRSCLTSYPCHSPALAGSAPMLDSNLQAGPARRHAGHAAPAFRVTTRTPRRPTGRRCFLPSLPRMHGTRESRAADGSGPHPWPNLRNLRCRTSSIPS